MKSSVSAYFNSIIYWWSSWRFIFSNKLAHFFLYPILITIVLSMGSLVLIKKIVSILMAQFIPQAEYQPAGDDLWQMLLKMLTHAGEYVAAITVVLLSFYIFNRISKYLVLSVMSPVMARLSERTEEILTGHVTAFDGRQFAKDILRGLAISLRNMLLEFIMTIAVWLSTLYLALFFPPLAIIVLPFTALLLFLISAYFYGFSVHDYFNERRKLSISESIREMRKSKGQVAGIGTIFALLFLIPYIGTTIGTITCTVAAVMQRLNVR